MKGYALYFTWKDWVKKGETLEKKEIFKKG